MISERMPSSPNLHQCVAVSLGLLVGIATISQSSTSAYGRNSLQIGSSVVDTDNIISNWDIYQNQLLLIKGKIECLTDNFCNFVPKSDWSMKILWVDIRMLPAKKKQHLALYCRRSCNIIVRGFVDLAMITAWDIWEPDNETGLYRGFAPPT